MYSAVGKRIVDVVCSAAALIVLSPILVAVAVLIWLEDRHSPIYRQERVGQHQRHFVILKFRSMPAGTANASSRDVSEPTVTRTGRVIRRLNIDELPQLVNILIGGMSIVGPRPSLPSQSDLIELRAARDVYRVKPGLTGLAQVESYDDMPDAEKADKDARYAQRVTLLGDVRILARTIKYLSSPPPKY